MKKILIIGAGAVSRAFSVITSEKNYITHILGTEFDRNFLSSIKKSKKKLGKFPRKVSFYDIDEIETVKGNRYSVIIFALNSNGIDLGIEILKKILVRPTPILLLTKGLILKNNKLETIPEYIYKRLRKIISRSYITSMSGPALANEISTKKKTFVIFSNVNSLRSKKISKLFETPFFIPSTSKDIIGTQICSAFKNIYSILLGSNILDSFNYSSFIFNQSVNELTYLSKKFGGKEISAYNLSGIGDLFTSAFGGRNSNFGTHLRKINNYKVIKNKYFKNTTIEGLDLVLKIGPTINKLVRTKKLDKNKIPLLLVVVNSILKKRNLITSLNKVV